MDVLNKEKIARTIVLGSSSVYRQELLKRLQIPFETASPQIDESVLPDEAAEQTARRLAESKARVVAKLYEQALVIGSDQVAVFNGVQLGKPLTYTNALKQLQLMRGNEVTFFTALCLLNSHTNQLQTRVVPYHVKFRQLSDRQIKSYLSKEQPYHCAGSAKSEGLGITLMEYMRGDDPNALIGLPLIALTEMLSKEGIEII
ncbi:nucleoside triphosphate pyrophosphatase [Nitrosomonas sp.]|uniref:Maf family protein n=1 Tax=Nitrosomonas sp. TaxID=42353 RepID=UPI001E08A9D1|nr:Maf family nucleotide pyrophosphatase [Nitrosomonas sp.]MCB1949993.1 septum formation inhibitor Maf [Nitrosomonas sp.]MCP5243357.1 septum formation inhibitor Maf [Burkholderiales bacterium]MDR4515069.1 Maf family nucleotide pyrophosphatase [Nitrosomonas sp.]